LSSKLLSKGYLLQAVNTALARLQEEGLLSDARFCEMFVRARVARGYGPQRIQAELRERGIDEAEQTTALAPYAELWLKQLHTVWRKRFAKIPQDPDEFARQARFLYTRGFTSEQIKVILQAKDTV
jgi:regulatory protein